MVLWLRALVTAGLTIAGRAFLQAYKNVTTNPAAAKAATENLSQTVTKVNLRGMQLEEARQILNLKDPKEGIEPNEVSESFVRLFKNNDVEKGGSFYLQSKIYRAKEALEAEMQERGVQFTPAEIPMPEPKPEESASESEEKK